MNDSSIGERSVSLIELKNTVSKVLSRSSLLRSLILSEPDFLSKQAFSAKVEIFVKLLYRESGRK